MFGIPVDIIACLLALYITMERSSGVAFVSLYLPILLLLNTTVKINLPGAPDMNATIGVVYGIVGGLILKGGEPFPFKWGSMDTLMVLLTLTTVITGLVTEELWTGVSVLGEQFMGYLVPYFMARVLFHSPEMRRRALWICVTCALIIAFFACIEMRLWPYFMSKTLKTVGLFTGQNTMVLERFGLFRAQTGFDHPIDMGNACILLAAMIAVMAMTTSVGFKNKWVLLGFAAAFCSSFSSLSFTAWVGIFAACATFGALWLVKFSRKFVIIGVLVLFCGFGYMTNKLYYTDVAARQEEEDSDKGQTVQDSMLVRAKIVQNCMPFVASSGFFGWGNTIRHSQLALESVDNSYMLFTMRRGFAFLTLFLMIPVVTALRAMKAFKYCRSEMQALPLAAGVAVILGIMAAMFTVWFGFAYSVMWVMMIGITHSMCDGILYGPPRAVLAQQKNGYAAMQQQRAYARPGRFAGMPQMPQGV